MSGHGNDHANAGVFPAWDEAALRLHQPGLTAFEVVKLLEESVVELGLADAARFVPATVAEAEGLGSALAGQLIVPLHRPPHTTDEPVGGQPVLHGYLVAAAAASALRAIEVLAAHAGVALATVTRLAEISQREEAVRRVAERLQDALMPRVPSLANTSVAVRYRAAGEQTRVGGDFYDVFPLPDGRVLIMVGDVMGKGIEAAGRTSRVTQTVRALALQDMSLEHLLERADKQVCFQDPGLMATVWCGLYEPDSGELHFASLGHPPALLLRAEGDPMYLTLQGLPMGMRDLTDEPPECRSRQLAPRDLLVLYTDGVVEASGDLVHGQEMLLDAVAARRALPLDELVDGALDELLANAGYHDDALMLLLRRR